MLVTGAGGFLGAATVRRLVALGARVRAWLAPAPSECLCAPPSEVDVIYGDVADPHAARGALRGIDCVIHAAGPRSTSQSFALPALYLRAHAVGTATIVEQCLALGVARLVYVSTARVYDRATAPIAEDHPRVPSSPLGAAALAAEHVLESIATESGLHATIVRPFSAYGAGASRETLIASVLATIDRNAIPQLADLRPVRDFCDVDDLADGIVRAACRTTRAIRAYNLCTGRGLAVLDAVCTILAAARRPDDAIRQRGAHRPGAEVLYLVGDPARAEAELGFRARTTFEAGVRRLLDERAV
ncbi:MAG TPA: NAD-dependent epimerase/dehydratase family protein [Kofleriaceae bacterium]|nr:NAD-dependent epimerase/dehydratase family protein [Kofleriaceae bacterium]